MTHIYKIIYIVLRISLPWDRIWTLDVQLVSLFDWRHVDCIQGDWNTIIVIDAGMCWGRREGGPHTVLPPSYNASFLRRLIALAFYRSCALSLAQITHLGSDLSLALITIIASVTRPCGMWRQLALSITCPGFVSLSD